MVTSLLEHGRITTTLMKAKELRSHAERTITLAARLGDILAKAPEARSKEEQARILHAVRLVSSSVRSREVVAKLFAEIVPKFAGRPGGYTRIVRTGTRPGDAAEMAIIELV
jgi:large subunit ribosomal protein L17